MFLKSPLTISSSSIFLVFSFAIDLLKKLGHFPCRFDLVNVIHVASFGMFLYIFPVNMYLVIRIFRSPSNLG